MLIKRSENSYINNDIIPFLNANFDYPIHDAEKVRINDVPIFRPSGGRAGSIDVVYYHNGEPVLLVEAKAKHKNHEVALKEALVYLKNFPIDKTEFSPSGLPPKILATAAGKDIRFYKWSIDYSKPIPGFITEEIKTLSFEELITYYGLSAKYKARILESKNFSIDFFDELICIFKYRKKEEKITKDVIKEAVYQIYNYLSDTEKYTGNYPYTELDLQGQKAIRDLFKRYDLIASLCPEIAKEFRQAILRSFQGAEFNQYLTNEAVVIFMVSLIGKLDINARVLDFECGSGGFLAAIADKNNLGLDNIAGFDIEDLPCIVAKTYFAFYFRKTGEELELIPIKKDNGLFYHGKDWDLIIGNPSGSNKYEHDDNDIIFENLNEDLDGNGKIDKITEYNLSVQQAVQSVLVGGKICLILPEGIFSNSQDEFLRKYIAKYCKILAVISLPSGSFRRGTSVKKIKGGSQSASMKMSLLFAKKIKEVEKGNGVETEAANLNYPIFLAHIEKAKSKKGEIDDWLEDRLHIILEQWNEWKNAGEIKNIIKVTTKFNIEDKIEKQKMSLRDKINDNKDEVKKEKKIKLKEEKSETRISEYLEDLLK